MNRGAFLAVVGLSALLLKLYIRAKRLQHDLHSLGFPQSIWSFYRDSVFNSVSTDKALKTACLKNGHNPFVFPVMGQCAVVPNTKELVGDFCRAPEDSLSLEAAADDLLQLQHLVGPPFCEETYHIAAIRTSLNRNLDEKLPDVVDEMVLAYREILESTLVGGVQSWTAVSPTKVFPNIICRASNRIFVGAPLCRDKEYCKLAVDFAPNVLDAGPYVKFLVPSFLRPVTGQLFRAIFGHHRRMLMYLEPLIKQRRQSSVSSLVEKENDMLTWLMDAPSKHFEPSAESLAYRMLNVNYVAIHTTSKSFVHALYHLAARPEYQDILRAEVEYNLNFEDPRTWTRDALLNCVKLDSFLKETLRLNGHGAIWMPRKSVQDFTFSDGTTVPAGHFVALAARAVHHDPATYKQPEEFFGLRFSDMQDKEAIYGGMNDSDLIDDESQTQSGRHRMTSASPSYLAFGGGKHICPGRFFASLELKCLLAYLLFKFDVKTEQEGVRPLDEWFGPIANPAKNATVLFRCRN